MKYHLMRFIWSHDVSIIAVSGTVALLLSIITIGRACKDSPSRHFPRKPADFYTQKKIDRKLAEINSMLDNDPENVPLLFESAILKYQKGPDLYPEAIIALEKARDSGLLDVRTFYYLGVMYQQKGLDSYAEKEYRRFLYNYPKDYDAYMLLGKSLYAQKKYKESAEIFENLLEKHNKDKILLLNAVYSLWKSNNDYYLVILNYLKTRGKEGKYLGLCAEGEILLETGNVQKAMQSLEEARKLKFAKKDTKIHILLAKASLENGDIDKAKDIISQANLLFEDNPEILAMEEKIMAIENRKRNKK